MIKKSLAALTLSGLLNSACTTAERIVSPPIELPVLELNEQESLNSQDEVSVPQQNLETVVEKQSAQEQPAQTSQQTQVEERFPLPLGTYNYDVYKSFIRIGSSKVVFEEYNSQGRFSEEYVQKNANSLLSSKKDKKLYYLKFATETIFGSLAVHQTFETVAFLEGNKVKPLIEVATGEENYLNLFYQEERRIHKLGKGEITLSQEDFDNTCEPLTLLIKLMTTKPSKTAKKISLCNFYAKELEQISINVEKEGENFCGVASLPRGVFFGSEQVQMKFYYFQKKDNKLYPVMNYELHVNPKGLGWFVFKFTELEKE